MTTPPHPPYIFKKKKSTEFNPGLIFTKLWCFLVFHQTLLTDNNAAIWIWKGGDIQMLSISDARAAFCLAALITKVTSNAEQQPLSQQDKLHMIYDSCRGHL